MMMMERFELAKNRIEEITKEDRVKEPYCTYFRHVALFLAEIFKLYTNDLEIDEMPILNKSLYKELLPENYSKSYANYGYSTSMLGEEFGQLLCFLYAEMYSLIPIAHEALYEKERENSVAWLVIRIELFIEIYGSFVLAADEGISPDAEAIRETIYWFLSDYAEDAWLRRTEEKLNPERDFAYQIIKNSDLSKQDYLYKFGEYISENEIETSKYLSTLDEETIKLMADTYTEGYRIGFVKGNKDLSKKSVVGILYPIGFERVIKIAIDNFSKMGLRPAIMRTSHSAFYGQGLRVNGYYSTFPNKQFIFDHREDEALFLDKKLSNRKLEAVKESHEAFKELAGKYAGPAWIEVFGESPFAPVVDKNACVFHKSQQELRTKYSVNLGQIVNEYIPGEERSFTIIAFPVPEIGEEYEAIMKDTIALNTLDYETYEKIQQIIINALDKGEHVIIKGANGNKTDLKVMLYPLKDFNTQTGFENCVADVNIPVGEVFTSPSLKGTEGILHVKQVYLSELVYKDLELTFKDGRITSYGCANFESEEANQKYIKDNLLFHHDTLPMGEFAIGTNTTAYVMGRKYNIQDKLPILIAEKTGPHFAVGDTCYSHAEDVAVYNLDGKEMIARENEYSALRNSDIEKAYFQCHTDITIPYDELAEISVVDADGKKTELIIDKRFVLPGTEKLNEAFDMQDKD